MNKIEEYRKKKLEDEESNKNVYKKSKKKEEQDEDIDIVELYYKEKAENKDPAQRRKVKHMKN